MQTKSCSQIYNITCNLPKITRDIKKVEKQFHPFKQMQKHTVTPYSVLPCSVLRLTVVSGSVASQVQNNITPFLCTPTYTHFCIFTQSHPLSSFSRNQLISLLTCREKKSLVRSVSHYLLPVRNFSQRKIPVFPLKSESDYSRLLACLQRSFRPLGHPLAVLLWVPLPVIPVVGYLCQQRLLHPTVVLPEFIFLPSERQWMTVSLRRPITIDKSERQGGRKRHSNSRLNSQHSFKRKSR